MNRRLFLASSGSAFALAACSSTGGSLSPLNPSSPAPPQLFVRREIHDFASDPSMLKSLRDGVRAMKAVRDPTDPRSWQYWHYSHSMPDGMQPPASMAAVWNQCKHGGAFFYTWHRGFVYYFEQMLREMSGNPQLALPYWNYYAHPALPEVYAVETLDDGSPNPLFHPGRTGTRIEDLSYEPFDPSIVRFPYDPENASTFERLAEGDPHGLVHDMIGGDMGSVPTAAGDPIFWAHHCNVDRLWSAWVAAGGGRAMPDAGDRWWHQRYAYDVKAEWTVTAKQMGDTRNLGFEYADLALPPVPSRLSLPPRPAAALRPAIAAAGEPLALGASSVSIDVAVERLGASPHLKLLNPSLTADGLKGGFSFGIYLNLPKEPVSEKKQREYLIGTIGSFDVSVAEMQAMDGGTPVIKYALVPALKIQEAAGFKFSGSLNFSFVRYGETKTRGALVNIGNVSVAS